MTDLFVGRQSELKELKLLLNKKSASMVVIRGRRRIGKSRLAEEFAKGHRFLSFSGVAPTSDTTAQLEREEFAKQLSHNLNAPQILANDWTDLFTALIQGTKQGRVIILLDEISWMGSKDPMFLGKLKNAWERLKDNPKLILILCGSVSVWIEKNILSSTGFMGRTSLDLVLEELPLNDCNRMLEMLGCKMSAYDKFKILSVTGGIPRYLEEVQPGLSADENIKRLCFNKSGILFREFNDIFHDLFTRRSQSYKRIVELLVNGPLEFTEICKRLKVKKSGFWSKYLNELVQSGFLKRDYAWGLKTGNTIKLSRFRLSDNYLRFYLKYIEPNKIKVESKLFNNKDMSSFAGWDSIMSLQFENLVLNNSNFIWEQLSLSPNSIIAHGAYYQNKTTKHAGCQIDYLIQTKFNTLVACEVKFARNEVKMEVIEDMHKKSNALQSSNSVFWPVLIHINGVSESVKEAGYFVHIINFIELLN